MKVSIFQYLYLPLHVGRLHINTATINASSNSRKYKFYLQDVGLNWVETGGSITGGNRVKPVRIKKSFSEEGSEGNTNWSGIQNRIRTTYFALYGTGNTLFGPTYRQVPITGREPSYFYSKLDR